MHSRERDHWGRRGDACASERAKSTQRAKQSLGEEGQGIAVAESIIGDARSVFDHCDWTPCVLKP